MHRGLSRGVRPLSASDVGTKGCKSAEERLAETPLALRVPGRPRMRRSDRGGAKEGGTQRRRRMVPVKGITDPGVPTHLKSL